MAFLEFDKQQLQASIVLSGEKMIYLFAHKGALTASEKNVGNPHAAILKEARSDGDVWVLLDYTGYQTMVNGLRVADCKIVREGDRIQIVENICTFKLTGKIVKETVSAGSPWLAQEVQCDFDLRKFEVGDEVVCCPQCNKPYHADCWQALQEPCSCGFTLHLNK